MTNNPKNQKKENYKFLTNQPSGEDLFKNKSQEKIANVISEKIINEPDFKIIGIDGSWGSGKSNLVKLIQNKLTNTHKFFIYDVWGHQEDEQRRAILTELTDFITCNEKNLVQNKDKWESKLKKLISKEKSTTTTNIPHLSIGFIISLLLIIYVPTINTFAKNADLWIQLVLVLCPILVLLIIFIKYYYETYKSHPIENKKKYSYWKAFKIYGFEATQKLFKVYNNQKVDETKIEIVSESEPTVKEFRKWMNEIDHDLKSNVVVVFDNFDRLPKKHILNIWSSIHIFFAEEEYKNIRVIIPFDREHVQNAFKDLNPEKKDSIDNNTFAEDYINKTFDIVFRVTLPIMSDWKYFFENQWKNAFSEYDVNELKLVVQVYEFLSRRITPREIISFINEILTVKLLDENFKERYIAIFILKKDHILKHPLKAVTELTYLKGLKSLYENDLEFAKQLTAIIYHIEIENALELIYTQQLKDSLYNNNVELFNTICKSEFIETIFIQAIVEIEIPSNPIKTLSQLDKETNLSKFNIEQGWKTLYYKVMNYEYNVDKLEIQDWQLLLIQNYEGNHYLSYLLSGYSKLIDDSNIEEYIDLVDKLTKDLGEERVLSQLGERNVSNENFIKLIEHNGKGYEKYKLTTDYNLLDEYLSKLSVDKILELKKTDCLPVQYDFKKYKEKLKSSLESLINQNEVQPANKVLFKINETSKMSGDLKDLLDDSKIHSLYSNYPSSDLQIINELIAMRIAKGSGFNSSYSSQFTGILNLENDKRAEVISNTILKYIEYGDLLLLSEHFNDSPLFRQIILKMFNKTDLGKKANIVALIEKYSEIKESLDIDDNLLLTEFNKWEIDKDTFNVNNVSDKFIDDCLNSPEYRITKDFLMVFNKEFKSLDKGGCETVFDDGTDVYFKYFKHLVLDNLTQTSLDVFESKLIEKLKSTNTVNSQWWNILAIYDSNNSTISIVNALKNILDEILTSKVEFKIDAAKRLIPYFIKYDLFKGRNDIFRLIIKNEFLSDSEFIHLLISNSEHIKKIYREAVQSDKEGFRNLINEKRDDNSEFENLAKSLDIRKSKE
jgi:hypothetical protein